MLVYLYEDRIYNPKDTFRPSYTILFHDRHLNIVEFVVEYCLEFV